MINTQHNIHSLLGNVEIRSIIQYLGSINDLITFTMINKKCQKVITTLTTNTNINHSFTKKEIILSPNLKTIKGKINDIINAVGIKYALNKNIEVSIEDTDDAIQWEGIAALCSQFTTVRYVYPHFLGQDILRLQGIFERAKQVKSINVICDALAKVLTQEKIHEIVSTFSVKHLIISSSDLTNNKHKEVLNTFTKLFNPEIGFIIISKAYCYEQIIEIKQLLPTQWKIVLDDPLLVSQAKTSDILLSSGICSKGYCIDDNYYEQEELNENGNEQREINKLNEEQFKFIQLYCPTITLRYANPYSFIPKNTYKLSITGQLPLEVENQVELRQLVFKESTLEKRTQYNLCNLTNLTSLVFQSYERRKRIVGFPLSLKRLEVTYDQEDDQEDSDLPNPEYHPLGLASLTQLTFLRMFHYKKSCIHLPESIVSVELKYCKVTSLSPLNQTKHLESISLYSCNIKTLEISKSVKNVKLINCTELKQLKIDGENTQCHFDISGCPNVVLE
ncbi:hypothetical protein CL6EHI_141390 [Entamoeba histolytica]|nr:hypothetical protein CL6EHI_141390 [Entamoeba histolytica]